jgi:hypothetical protein
MGIILLQGKEKAAAPHASRSADNQITDFNLWVIVIRYPYYFPGVANETTSYRRYSG